MSSTGPIRRATDVRSLAVDLVPQIAGIAAAALVLAGKDEDEILQSHFSQAPRRAHRHMMALATEHAADHENHLVLRGDAEGAAHRVGALGGNRGRIEQRKIDARRHHFDPAGRNVVALADQFGELVADRDDAIAARHHAVIEALQRILFAEALVPAGDERHARQLGSDEGAPGRRAAMRMDDVAAATCARCARSRPRCAP